MLRVSAAGADDLRQLAAGKRDDSACCEAKQYDGQEGGDPYDRGAVVIAALLNTCFSRTEVTHPVNLRHGEDSIGGPK